MLGTLFREAQAPAPREHSRTWEILTKAKTILDDHGWCQGSYYKADGRVCLIGAVHEAATGVPAPSLLALESGGPGYALMEPLTEEFTMARAHLAEFVPTGDFLGKWNDTYNRTVEEVQALLDTAIGALA